MIVTDLPAPMEIYKSIHKFLIEGQESHAIVLDLKVIDNPILANEDNYKALYHRIKQYNQKVLKEAKVPIDSYETETHNHLYRILGEINAMANKEIQIDRLRVTR